MAECAASLLSEARSADLDYREIVQREVLVLFRQYRARPAQFRREIFELGQPVFHR